MLVENQRPLVGLVDSGTVATQQPFVQHYRDFVEESPIPVEDVRGHGATLTQVVLDMLPNVQLAVARVFTPQLTTTPQRAAAGIDWLVDQGCHVINLSFGLQHDRPSLAHACRRAIESGVILVASSPAVGAPVFPASYPGVIRVTGDARCQPGEYSWRPSPQADFGACVRAGHERVIGASVAAAYLSARIGAYLSNHYVDRMALDHLFRWLYTYANFQHRQRPFSLVACDRRLTWDGAG